MDGVSISADTAALSAIDLVRAARGQMTAHSLPASTPVKEQAPIRKVEIESYVATSSRSRALPAPKASRLYAAAFLLATFVGMAAVVFGNQSYGPEMYGTGGMVPVAAAHEAGLNYGVFDLNINIRALRDAQIARMKKAPDVVLLGASHYQEGDHSIAPGIDFFNSHIHRDYWEDLLGMVNLYVKHDKLPKTFIISIRDLEFTPVDQRKDFLWEPGIPSYREMSERLGIEPESYIKTLPYNRMWALLSFPMLFENLTRWHNANELPGPSTQRQFEALDTLLPDGSIVWSRKHLALFTPERTKRESAGLANQRMNITPLVDPQGVAAFDKLLDYLKARGVEVYLMHPPYNPMFYDAIQGSTYAAGQRKVEELVQDIANRHGLKVFGSYNPHKVGCDASLYIDAEHSNIQCLKKLFAPFVAMKLGKVASQ